MKTEKPRIYLVEDDMNFGSVLCSFLELHGFEIDWIQNGKKAIAAFTHQIYDLCILDIMLPSADGFAVAANIKQTDPEVPVIFLTAKSLKTDVVKGFNIGADDYLTKPFDSEVLILKIQAILRRKGWNKKKEEKNIFIGKYIFDTNERILVGPDGSQKLSPRETELFVLLYESINQVVVRDQVLKTLWGESSYFTGRSMDVFIARLRKLLSSDTAIEIINIHGTGYMLKYHPPSG